MSTQIKFEQRDADHEIKCMEEIAALLKAKASENQLDLFNQQKQ